MERMKDASSLSCCCCCGFWARKDRIFFDVYDGAPQGGEMGRFWVLSDRVCNTPEGASLILDSLSMADSVVRHMCVSSATMGMSIGWKKVSAKTALKIGETDVMPRCCDNIMNQKT